MRYYCAVLRDSKDSRDSRDNSSVLVKVYDKKICCVPCI